MNTNTSESPIVNAPVSNSPIISSPIMASDEPLPDFNDACAAGMPAGHRMFYFKFVAIAFAVMGTLAFGLYKLCERLA